MSCQGFVSSYEEFTLFLARLLKVTFCDPLMSVVHCRAQANTKKIILTDDNFSYIMCHFLVYLAVLASDSF